MSLNKIFIFVESKISTRAVAALVKSYTAALVKRPSTKSYDGTLLRAAAGPEQELPWDLRSLSDVPPLFNFFLNLSHSFPSREQKGVMLSGYRWF
jgi:hypothetical protein